MINFSLSFGEALDRLSILEIKTQKLQKLEERDRAAAEHSDLKKAVTDAIDLSDSSLQEAYRRLFDANLRMWDAMQSVYDWSGPRTADFEGLILAIVDENKDRAFAKREIDILLKSKHLEAKSFF